MQTSLFFRLMGAFALVILVGFTIVYVVANAATASEFQHFMFRGQMVAAQDLANQMADFYGSRGSWNGVEAILRESSPSGAMGGMMSGMMGSSRLWLADARGTIVAGSDNSREGQTAAPSELASGTPIRSAGQTVGTLIISPGMMGSPTDASSREFLAGMNRSLLLAGIAAALVALALGFLIFRQITAPLDALAQATTRLAAGNLHTRAVVRGNDEISRLGRSFNAMAENLERSEAARRSMLADVAHELRNPLGVIQSHLEAMLDGVFPTTSEQIASLHDETMLLTRLVDDLREIALADAGQLSLHLQPADLSDIVERTTAAFQVAAAEHGIILRTEIIPDMPQINLDAHRIDQVLRNLISNALRYSTPGSTVLVQLKRETDGVCVQVSDNGPGIPPDALEHVFERFWRGDPSRSRSLGGTGLGLAIAKQWIQMHGGQIGVTSQTGHGTTFWFTLPSGRSG